MTEAYRAVRERIMDVHDKDPMFARLIAIGGLDEFYGIKQPKLPEPDRPVTVYYVQVGHLVKIGCTENLKRRLLAYPPYRRVLALEHDSSWAAESQRLIQFAEYLAEGKEWFRPGPALIEHINKIRRKTGAKPIVKFMPDVA
jgi:hypothetical protein